jgi:Tol biopolymer transport system component
MKRKNTLRMGAVIIAATAAAFALSATAGAGPVTGPNGPRASHIAYMSKVDGEADIYTMTTSGFTQTNLTHDKTVGMRADSEPAWSPNGQYVAFQRTGIKAPGTRLYVVRSDGSDLHALAPPSNVSASDMHPTWSPDGQWIVFSSDRTGHFELYMIKASGAGLVRRTFTKLGVDNLEPAWSPDGASIAFVRVELSAASSAASIYTLNLMADAAYRVTKPMLGRGDYQPSWSGDSRQIAFESSRTGKMDVYVVGRTGKSLRAVTPLTSNETHPTWAPFGNQIALISDRTGATEIYTLEVRAPGPSTQPPTMRQLTFDKAPKANPAWERNIFMGPTS